MARTLQAMRQAVYAALTDPQLSYTVNAGAPTLLPVACVLPRYVWEVDNAQPEPFVCFAIAGSSSRAPAVERWLGDRDLELQIWVVSAQGTDEVSEIYEAVRGRLNYADQEQISAGRDLSRAATGSTLAIAVRDIRETWASDPGFEPVSNKWQMSARYKIVAR